MMHSLQTADGIQYFSPEIGSAGTWPLVLYFHHIHPKISHYTSITPSSFDRALDIVAKYFIPLDPKNVCGMLDSGPPSKPFCLLTFDDGYLDVWQYAAPILEEYKWRAVFFVSTSLVGQTEIHPARGKISRMQWDHLRYLSECGHLVASHGSTHVNLQEVRSFKIIQLLDEADEDLQSNLGYTSRLIAYPYGCAPKCANTDELQTLVRDRICFGSVKARAVDWRLGKQEIRRTYLPSKQDESWNKYVEGWYSAWMNCAWG